MSLQQTIHRMAAAHRPLAELLAPERFYTGPMPQQAEARGELQAPYATLEDAGLSEVERLSGGRELTVQTLRFAIYAQELDEARRITEVLEALFANRSFPAEDAIVQDMKRTGRRSQRQDSGLWRVEVEFVVRVERNAG